jgi:cell division protein ZapA
MAQVTVTINGRSYRMACEDGQEEHLRGLARRLDDMVEGLRGDFGEIGDQRLTVMAAIMCMDELSEMQRRLKGLEAENRALTETRSAVLDRAERSEQETAKRVGDLARRLEDLAQVISNG